MTRIAWIVAIALLVASCSKDDQDGARSGKTTGDAGGAGSTEVMARLDEAVRVLARPDPTIDLVAARLEGRISERSAALATIQYDGYRILLITPGDLVTRIDFDLQEARPTVGQLTDVYGVPKPIRNTLLFTHEFASRDQRMNIVAEPVSSPAEPTTPVSKIVVRGARRN